MAKKLNLQKERHMLLKKSMLIGGLHKFSLIDYPEKIAAVVFTYGCNFRCPYCHNPELLYPKKDGLIPELQIFDFLKTRTNKLDAVVISGGEPCLQQDLIEFMRKIKDMGFLVKLDTNGSFPQKIQEIIELGIVDYLAMDVKGPVNKYRHITNSNVNTNNILQSIDIIINSSIDHEFRTTVVKSQLAREDIFQISSLIKGSKRYYLQKFIPSKTLDQSFSTQKSYTEEEFISIKTFIEEKNLSCSIR